MMGVVEVYVICVGFEVYLVVFWFVDVFVGYYVVVVGQVCNYCYVWLFYVVGDCYVDVFGFLVYFVIGGDFVCQQLVVVFCFVLFG